MPAVQNCSHCSIIMETVGEEGYQDLRGRDKDAQATIACLRLALWSLERFFVGNRSDDERHRWHELFLNK
jgi:hypothetical protein